MQKHPPAADPAFALPDWTMPPDLATIVAEDGEWEDASWDPLLLSVVGDTRFEGRLIPLAWQLTLWTADAPAVPGTPMDGPGWADRLLAGVEAQDPALAARVHDSSEADACILWVEREADGRTLMEAAWRCLHGA